MSSHGSGDSAVTLKELAALDAFSPPPYGYEEFARRHARDRSQRRVLAFAAAASVAALGVLVSVALRESRAPSPVETPAFAAFSPADTVAIDVDGAIEPALVEVDRLVLRNDLEDRIAWFDAALSAGRVEAVPNEELLQIEAAREQLARSLQHVSYAHALLDY